MTDWTKAMEQTYEYYEVDPISWADKKKIDNIITSTIDWDTDAETLGSASIEAVNLVGECYIRIYLVTIQNGNKEKHPLGTFLVQTPSSKFDGKINSVSMDAYTPLIELKENPLPLGYTLLEGENIMDNAYRIAKDNCRCPVIKTTSTKTLNDDFVANTDDTYISFLSDLIDEANYKFGLDEMGRILFNPVQKLSALQPVFTFDDGNSSILYPEITLKHDLYGIPNVVEVMCSNSSGGILYATATNDDENSPTSIQNRGRKIIYRDTSPSLAGYPTQEQLDEYATNLLESLSSVAYTITFSHGYYPVRPGDCIRLNYNRAGLQDIKAQILCQSISCKPGCEVQTTAAFIRKLWN